MRQTPSLSTRGDRHMSSGTQVVPDDGSAVVEDAHVDRATSYCGAGEPLGSTDAPVAGNPEAPA